MRIPRAGRGASCAMALPGRSRIPSKSCGLNRRRGRAETIRQDPPRSVSPGDLPAHLRAKVIAVRSPVKSRAAMDTVHWLPASKVFVPGCLVPLLAACQLDAHRFNLDHATRRNRMRRFLARTYSARVSAMRCQGLGGMRPVDGDPDQSKPWADALVCEGHPWRQGISSTPLPSGRKRIDLGRRASSDLNRPGRALPNWRSLSTIYA
jgi:hypothetical protein